VTLTVDPMTLIHERDLALLKAYSLAKKVKAFKSESIADRQTDRHADRCD